MKRNTLFCGRGPRDSTRKWRGGAQKSSAKHLGAEKKASSYLLYRFITEEQREDQRTARCHASKFRVAHSAHMKGLVYDRDKAALQKPLAVTGPPAGCLDGSPPTAMRPVDRQAAPIWPLSEDSSAVLRGQTGGWRVSRHGCSNLQATC